MNSISELRLLTPRPATLAGPGYQTAKAGAVAADPQSVATAPVQDERPAARTQAPEPTRAQGAEQRLTKNRNEREQSWNEEGVPEVELSFGEFLDLINPLHHIPIVGTIYRAITGDEIGGPAKILGGLLFGGPIGFIASILDTIVTQATGRDLGETVMAAFIDRDAAPAVQVADAPDIQSMPAQGDAPEDSAPTANGPPGPVTGHRDPFGLERGVAAPIAVTPGTVTPGAVAEPPERPAAPGARPPAPNGRPLAAATLWPRAATVPGIGLGEKPPVPVAQGPDASPVPVASAPGVAVDLVAAGAPKPGTQRLVPSAATTDRDFAERMIEALDKYRALASERYRDHSRATRRLDLDL